MGKGKAAAKDFNPAEYVWQGNFYLGDQIDMMLAYSDDHRELDANLGFEFFEDYAKHGIDPGRCQSCGTHYAHGTVYRHDPTGSLLAVGHECAMAYFRHTDIRALKQSEARKSRQAKERKARIAENVADILAENPALAVALETDHYIVADIKDRLYTWGTISPAQVELVFKIESQEAERAVEDTTPQVPVVEGSGLTVSGEVLSHKWQESDFGLSHKMLVKVHTSAGAYKVWGTVPSAIDEVEKGDTVKFVANFERSNDDDYFGFYKRPRKAEITAKGESE